MSNTRSVHFDMAVPSRCTAQALPTRRAKKEGKTWPSGPERAPFLRGGRRRAVRATALPLPFSPVTLAVALSISLAVAYIALIATVMSYASMTVSFAQSVRDDEAQVATLEGQYLAAISSVTATDYASQGYEKPTLKIFVPQASRAALR